MKPQDRTSPKNRIDPATLHILFTSSDPDNGTWSVAKFNWWDNAWVECIGLAWNGDLNNPKDVGWPNSRNQGTWFIVPNMLAPNVKAFAETMAVFVAATKAAKAA